MEIDIRFVTLKNAISLLDDLRAESNGLLADEIKNLEVILQKPMLMVIEKKPLIFMNFLLNFFVTFGMKIHSLAMLKIWQFSYTRNS